MTHRSLITRFTRLGLFVAILVFLTPSRTLPRSSSTSAAMTSTPASPTSTRPA